MLDRYPHEFSGGMRQRAVIAMALARSPQLIIADEPTTALDVIVQDQILKELKRIQAEMGMSIIYISHDIAVIAEVTDSLGVMYAGKLVEYGRTAEIFARPGTRTPTCSCARRLDHRPAPGWRRWRASRPTSSDRPPAVATRAARSRRRSAPRRPPLADIGGGHRVACWHHDGSRSSRQPSSDDDLEHCPRRARPSRPGPAAPRGQGPRDAVPDLARSFPAPTDFVHAVDGISFEIAPGESLGLVGVGLRQVDDGPDAREAE